MKRLLFLIALFVFLPITVNAKSGGMVIDSFKTGDIDSRGNEFIVVANSGDSELDLTGFSLKKKLTSGSYISLILDFKRKLGAKQKLFITYSGNKIPADFYYGSGISDDTSLILFDNKGIVVDTVGYGGAIAYEKNKLLNPGLGEVYSRTEMIDTDDNLADFSLEKEELVLDKNVDKLLITELLPNPESGEEWFELFNPTSQPISLQNLKVCDNSGSIHCYYFAKDEFLPSLSYKAYFQGMTKITLNDTGDSLELLDVNDNLLFGTDMFEGADDGISFSLFGNEWKWTKYQTLNTENIFEDIIEVEEKPVKSASTTKKKVAATKKKTVKPLAEEVEEDKLADETVQGEVKAAKTKSVEPQDKTATKAKISKKTVGWGLVTLAILGLVFYTILESKDKLNDFYNKFRNRNG